MSGACHSHGSWAGGKGVQVLELPRPEPRHLKPLPRVRLVPWRPLGAAGSRAVAVAWECGPAGPEQSNGGMGRRGLVPCLPMEQLLLEPQLGACACCQCRWQLSPCTMGDLRDDSMVS